MHILKWDLENLPSEEKKQEIVDFLYHNLEEYGDEKKDIYNCVQYTFNELNDKITSGFIITAEDNQKLLGVCIVNETGMEGYIPENILVYIATHSEARGKGIGKQIMQKVIEEANGSIALHVEAHNPAKKLYEKLGFTNKYLEMRYNK